jgi:putative nucleotidyltransferase with HDIG domain
VILWRGTLSNLQLEKLIKNTSDLPSMPEHAFEVIRITGLAETSAVDIAKTLSKDPSLAARVLRLANSSFYGLTREVSSISDAVVVLGMRTVKSLALVAASFPWLQKALKGNSLNPDLLWTHCFTTAVTAKLLAKKTDAPDAEIAFCAALLHDMGSVILCLWKDGDFTDLIEEAINSGATFDAVEKEILGFDHAEVGAALTRQWNLPEVYCNAIEYHHHPSNNPNDSYLSDIIHISDWLVRTRGINEGISEATYAKDEAAFERIGLDFLELEAIINLALQEADSYHRNEQGRAA